MPTIDEVIFKLMAIVSYEVAHAPRPGHTSSSALPRYLKASVSFDPHSDIQIEPSDGSTTHAIYRITPERGWQQVALTPEAAAHALLKLWRDELLNLKVRDEAHYAEVVRVIEREFPRAYEAVNTGQDVYHVPPPQRRHGNGSGGAAGYAAIAVLLVLVGLGVLLVNTVFGGLLRGGSGFTPDSGGSSPSIIYQNALTTPDSAWEPDQNCFFASDGLHVKPNKACQSPVREQGDVDVSVRMRQISGARTAGNGIEVRRSGDPASLYEFDIYATGRWLFKVCIQGFSDCDNLGSGNNRAINAGVGATNTIEIRAVGSQFTLLVNGTQVGQVDDTSLASGDVWLDTDPTAECVFTDFVVTRPS